ncbi:2,3-dihydro-2,3-dihydroxybenzoate dehydrogenase [Acinetobacter baumannii]|jgi:Dehydrogenases with different specificities (related to short-chain alcohol dehydrogenases)|uniref:2,3-dihydro-2,3-dihydroxybenzoate dehydrogenase n=2 Tax=Acinetobacter baumannii TaxID=470 RepID=A0A1E3MAV2_ACIBA|nr:MULTISPECIES: 2,3-dihydro-2,3-dihydroxybenzoate dehydrogenase [Acinetobacter]ABO12996.2 23-dihydro-2,3-dihydroxybenzoate dehydrogenase [Acinetobacter baumannii ATCC 17978]AKQ26040.1 2,3-dihydroxybenzoate-2,3-dehydrogenase [Acinetobacter baumannii]ALJ86085.1 2,3-dihydro-2,3-dihydroxybenzoate dehydrogenase [Acinetobacter baumannii]APP29619.1 2,3-dihydro-2,3-dihydroxybenzoate dehydrogenase [Acinetobacter baumannii]APX48087.1 2,3-dihydro-2,3-dihydroxybenzoate dehydrogenase [Acinetobacter bauman
MKEAETQEKSPTLTHSADTKIAWVTGVNQGMGAEIMQRLIAQHIYVVGFDLSTNNIVESDRYEVHQCDVRDAVQISSLCQKLLKTSPPDYFINTAGVLHLDEHDTLPEDAWLQTFEVNTFAPFYFLKHLSPYFREKRNGNIVMVSSNSAHVPRMKMAAYGASKAALTSFSKTVGLELAEYGIRVNIVSPGSTATPMLRQLWKDASGEKQTIHGNLAQYKVGIPLQKIALTEDIAHAVMFLISDQASHITMHDLVIDGGATLGQ